MIVGININKTDYYHNKKRYRMDSVVRSLPRLRVMRAVFLYRLVCGGSFLAGSAVCLRIINRV